MTWTAWFALAVTATVVIGLARNMAADALLWGAVIACGLAVGTVIISAGI